MAHTLVVPGGLTPRPRLSERMGPVSSSDFSPRYVDALTILSGEAALTKALGAARARYAAKAAAKAAMATYDLAVTLAFAEWEKTLAARANYAGWAEYAAADLAAYMAS